MTYEEFIKSERFVHVAFLNGRMDFFDDRLTEAYFGENPYDKEVDPNSYDSWVVGWNFSNMIWDEYLNDTFVGERLNNLKGEDGDDENAEEA